MSAKVDISNIPADQDRSFFANVGCRSSGIVVQRECHSPASINGSRSVHPSDDAEWEKSPEDPETDTQESSKRHNSFSVVERNVVGKQRRYSDKFSTGALAFSHRRRGGRMGRYHAAERLRERIVLPTRFLLGGNITDPLNLNSLCDDAVNRSMNETTPISSPVPVPVHRLEVQVMMPVNSADPLNLNAADSDVSAEIKPSSVVLASVFRKRRKRNRRKKRMRMEQCQSVEQVNEKSLHVEVCNEEEMHLDKPVDDTAVDSTARQKRVIDHIVSPVIPQRTSKWKRRRTASESRTETIAEDKVGQGLDMIKAEKPPIRHKRRHLSMHMVSPHVQVHFRAKDRRFSHGSYSRTRTVLGDCEDRRLLYFSEEMFSGKDILDIGCGVGNVSLAIARDFHARSVVGLDIDRKVVDTALKNKQHFASAMLPDVTRFPVAIRRRLGPLVAPQLLPPSDSFPDNVTFLMGDYVPRSEAELEQQSEEYDIIVGLRITKWIHLNYGDVGLKWAFRRMFRQLRPGGLLVLEMQPWKSYRKKKKLTEHILQMYRSIEFRPDMFADYLTSREVGFASCERLRVRPQSRHCIGVNQALYVFKKPENEVILPSRSLVSVGLSQQKMAVCSTHATPDRMSSCCWMTPKFDVGSTSCSTTPCSTYCRNTPSAADDLVSALSPCSSSSSSSSSTASSCERSRTHVGETSSATVQCVEPCDSLAFSESNTTSNTACLPDECVASMHPTTQHTQRDH